jgi:predicted nucleic acid-binding protein
MIVVDTNIIGYMYLGSDRSTQAEQALSRDAEWAAPILWRSELRNVLVKYIRNQWLSLEGAAQVMDEAIALMRDREFEVSSLQVLSLAALSACSAYDCEFVALARALQVPLVTVDRQVLKHFSEMAVSLEDFVAQ